MKLYVDFEIKDESERAMARVLGAVTAAQRSSSVLEAGLVVVDSVDKVLHYLQNTSTLVVQFCHNHHHPMSHLVEDYPTRLQVVDCRESSEMLKPVLEAIAALMPPAGPKT